MQRININGIAAEHLSIMDRGLLYGDGLFETMACRGGAIQFWDEHLTRMNKGADRLGIEFPGEKKYFQDIQALLDQAFDENCIIKLLLTRGQGERGYRQPHPQRPTRAVIINRWPQEMTDPASQGIKVYLCENPVSINPALAGIKHLNRLDNVLARNEWNDEFHEGFMFDSNGNLIEGTMSNIFCVKDEALFTPRLDQGGVKGVIRQQVLSIAKEKDFKIHIKKLTLDDIYSMDEIFITNSIIGIWSVASIGETRYPPGMITRRLQSELKQRIKKHAKTVA